MKNKSTHRVITLNGREISYEWIRKKVKNINLRVRGDGTISVSSPYAVSAKQIEMFLTEKANFLFRALDTVEKRKKTMPEPPTFLDGESIYLFGEPKILHFSPHKGGAVEEKDDILTLTPEDTAGKTKRKLQKYAETEIKDVITTLCEKVYPLFPEVKKFPEIRFRAMRATWGSCRPRENILTFNTRLACYPMPCIEYIVMHEFTHFLVPDHSAAFYTRLAQKMPDWKERKASLNSVQIQSFF